MMRQKSVLLFAASWLVLRLRWALLSSRLVLHEMLHVPEVLLVTRRQEAHAAGEWLSDGARVHFMLHDEEAQRIHVRSFPSFERN